VEGFLLGDSRKDSGDDIVGRFLAVIDSLPKGTELLPQTGNEILASSAISIYI